MRGLVRRGKVYARKLAVRQELALALKGIRHQAFARLTEP